MCVCRQKKRLFAVLLLENRRNFLSARPRNSYSSIDATKSDESSVKCYGHGRELFRGDFRQ